MTLFAGVDGGGTRTRAVIIDAAGREVVRGSAPGAVATAHAPEHAADAVAAALARAVQTAGAAGLTGSSTEIRLPLAGLWAGLAGAGSEASRRAVTAALEARSLARRLAVGTDVEAAYGDAFPEDDGVLLISGTGSIAWSGVGAATDPQVGGWGQHLGDEGSGFSLGTEALRHVLRAYDGRDAPSAMTGPVLAACATATPGELVPWRGGASKAQVAALAPIVLEAAEGGDAAAARLVEGAVSALVELAQTAARRRDRHTRGVVLWGGLIQHGGPLRDRVTEGLRVAGLAVVDRPVDPPLGAARRALSL